MTLEILARLPRMVASDHHVPSPWPTFASKVGRRVIVDGRDVLMFGSNDYLGLGGDQRTIDSACDAVQRYGAGHGMNPALGITSLHRALIEAMAAFTGCEDVVLFNSCTAANCALIPTLVGEGMPH